MKQAICISEDYDPLEDLSEKISDQKADFLNLKEEFKTWKEIKTAAEEILSSTQSNPLQSLEDDFRQFLARLSDDQVTLSSFDKKLKADIYSGNNKMTYELLSEGTKDTISLAFRLAVLKFLFPDGGGFAVFDDPFTDMDEERRNRACELLKEFAKANQIVFATCDKAYMDRLPGNRINLDDLKKR